MTDPNALIATEVFAARGALARQNAQPEVAAVLQLIEAGALSMPPEGRSTRAAAELPAL